jgi:gag-polypeptide of LTR copia-type
MSFNVTSSLSSISKLDGSNCTTWATTMKVIFGLHNLDRIIEGFEMVPTDAKEALESTRRSNQAYSLIILSLKDSLHHLINSHMTAKDLWDHIKKQYKKPGALAASSRGLPKDAIAGHQSQTAGNNQPVFYYIVSRFGNAYSQYLDRNKI